MWDSFCPPVSWYDNRYVEIRFEHFTPSADGLVGKTLNEDDIIEFNLPETYLGKIIESVSYPSW